MAGRLADVSTAVSATLPAMGPADFVWVKNISAGAITVSPPVGYTFTDNLASLSLPQGKSLHCTMITGSGGYVFARQAD